MENRLIRAGLFYLPLRTSICIIFLTKLGALYMSEAFDKKVTEFFRTYQDRGMKKWQGFFLSDHTSTLRKDRQQKAMTYPKKAETEAHINCF